jgi:GNAT superfamily N-acetyltransferase
MIDFVRVQPDIRWREEVSSAEVDALHAVAFGHEPTNRDWFAQMQDHSLGWVTARLVHDLVGFVNVAWDGGAHAFVIDTAVSPNHQRERIGSQMVAIAGEHARQAGCEWLHVDFEPSAANFYLRECGFSPTAAGLLRLR